MSALDQMTNCRCGALLLSDYEFCPECGSRVGIQSQESGHSPPGGRVAISEVKLSGQELFVPWMLRIGMAIVIFEILLMGPQTIFRDLLAVVMLISALTVGIVGAELLNFIAKRRAAEFIVTKDGVEIEPPRLWFGWKVGKKQIIGKDHIQSVELGRSLDSPLTGRANPPEGGWPSSLAFTSADGRIRSANRRDPAELLNAAALITESWNLKVEDAARKTMPHGSSVYGEFVNSGGSTRLRFIFAFFTLFVALFVYLIIDVNLSKSPTSLKIGLTGVFGFMIAYIMALLYLAYRRATSLKRAITERDGFTLIFKSRRQYYTWHDLLEIKVFPSDQWTKANQRAAFIRVPGLANRYEVNVEIGRAMEAAYGAANGFDRPITPQQPHKAGQISNAEFTKIKYQRPELYRRYMILTGLAFFDLILVLLAAALDVLWLMVACIVMTLVITYLQMKTKREMLRATGTDESWLRISQYGNGKR